MRSRKKLRSKSSKRMFTKHASKIHTNNLRAVPMRGGFRI